MNPHSRQNREVKFATPFELVSFSKFELKIHIRRKRLLREIEMMRASHDIIGSVLRKLQLEVIKVGMH